MKTGYFANGITGKYTKVHITYNDGVPICNSKIGPSMVFQWCAGYAELAYTDCQHCQKKYKKIKKLLGRTTHI